MGQIASALFGVLTFIALALIATGIARRSRAPAVLGGALLVSLAGAWLLGFLGVAAGLLLLPLARKRRAEPGGRT